VQSASAQGFLNLHKPLGWTSHDCVAKIRGILGQRKVGHGGTLDPLATGVLPIALGRATRLLPFLPADKAYRAVIRFGVTTATDDLEGDILDQRAATHLTQGQITAALPQFLGQIQQLPPRYSAIQVNGQRLYDLARQGQTVDLPHRTVRIHQIQPLRFQPGDQPELTVDIHCGGGTYIRSLARDLGESLGTGATLAALERTASCGFDLSTSLTLDDLVAQVTAQTFTPLPPDQGVAHLPGLTLTPDLARRWRQGQKLALGSALAPALADQVVPEQVIPLDPDKLPPGQPIRIEDESGHFLGIAVPTPWPEATGTYLKAKMVFASL
jgi:tRNA pseudouridine55 synthase